MKGNKKIKDSFENIAVEIRAGGLNVKQWAKTKGFPLTTVRYALYGYPPEEWMRGRYEELYAEAEEYAKQKEQIRRKLDESDGWDK